MTNDVTRRGITSGFRELEIAILITLGTQYQLLRPVSSPSGHGLFFHVSLAKDKANLAMARRQLQAIESQLIL